MKISTKLMLTPLLLFGLTLTMQAQFTPAPTDGNSVTFTTEKAASEKIKMIVNSATNNVWIDLNANQKYDEGEELNLGSVINEKVINTQDLCVYGDLTDFRCFGEKLTVLDVSKQPNLEILFCLKNQLKKLDISKNPKLIQLGCEENQLTTLNLSEQTDLIKLWCSANKITSLDLSKTAKLKELYCEANQIKEPEMQVLVESLPTQTGTLGKFLVFSNNPVDDEGNVCNTLQVAIAKSKKWRVWDDLGNDYAGTAPSVPTFTPAPTDGDRLSFTTLLPMGSSIGIRVKAITDNTWIDLNGDGAYQDGERIPANNETEVFKIQTESPVVYGELTAFACYDNQISKIDFIQVPNLIYLSCPKNQLSDIDLSKIPLLKELYCWGNQLSTLDLSKTSNLVQFFCHLNQFKSIDLSHLPNLFKFSCYNNQISESAMQAIIESLPTPTNPGFFYPVDPNPANEDPNICTPAQVALAKSKNWQVLDPDNNPFGGTVAVSDIHSDESTIKVYTKAGAIEIQGLRIGQVIQIYSLDGGRVYNKVAKSSSVSVAIAPSSYILRIGNYSTKIVL